MISVAIVAIVLYGFTSKTNTTSQHKYSSAGAIEQNIYRPVIRTTVSNSDAPQVAGPSENDPAEKIYEKLLKDVINLVDQGEINKAIGLVEGISDEYHKCRLREAIAYQWSLLDHVACLDWISKFKTADEKNGLIRSAIGATAEKNIDAAVSMIDLLTNGSAKNEAMSSLVHCMILCKDAEMIDRYSEEIIKRLRYFSDPGSIGYAAKSLASIAVANGGPEPISRIMDQLPYGNLRDRFVSNVVSELSRNRPAEAMDWFSKNATHTLEDISSSIHIATSFATINPLQGLEEAEKLTDPKLKGEYLNRFGDAWAVQKPDDAKQWLTKAILESDFEMNRNIAQGVLQGLLSQGEETGLQYIQSIPDLASRDSATLYAVSIISVNDPESAIKILGPYLNIDSVDTRETVRNVTSNWLYRDKESAAKWIGNIPIGNLRDIANKQLAKSQNRSQ